MPRALVDDMRDDKTPDSVVIRTEAKPPETDPTLGVAVAPPAGAPARQRLVAIGDSLTHGFQSAAIYHTDVAYPRIIAWEMGWDAPFRYPRYAGAGGLPLNIEFLIRRLESQFGNVVNWWELAAAAFSVRGFMDEVETYWERGPGAEIPRTTGINHNLGIYGWDLRDALSRSSRICSQALTVPKDNVFAQVVENANDRAALRVLPLPANKQSAGSTQLDAAQALGNDGGIETLIVFLGANNALRTVVDLNVVWSTAPDYQDLDRKAAFTVWDPDHFAVELAALVARVGQIAARHVIWATVPHVTVAPIARGVARKVGTGSRYFPYYTRPWISDEQFDPNDDPRITEQEARAVDSAIDQYNEAIAAAVRSARQAGRDWYLVDVAGMLDRLASRRYIEDLAARPSWWTPYELPPELAALSPAPNSRFFASGPDGRTAGGLFSLDGVHPTTVGYGLVAQEFINVMQLAGVTFYYGDGKTPRSGPIKVDFRRLIALDTLISDPPRSLSSDIGLIGWIDQKVDVFKRLFRSLS
jgi:hypothetical protein